MSDFWADKKVLDEILEDTNKVYGEPIMRDFEQSGPALNVTTHKYTKLCQFAREILDLDVKQERIVYPFSPLTVKSMTPANATRFTVKKVSPFKSAVGIIPDEEIDRARLPANDLFFEHLRDMIESFYENSQISAEKDGTISIRVV